MVRKVGVDDLDDIQRDGIRRKPWCDRNVFWAGFTKTFAVFSIKIPLPAHRFARLIHQHLVLLSHQSVEILHTQAGGLARPLAKLGDAAKEMLVLTPLYDVI